MIASTSELPKIGLIGVSGYASIHVEWLLQAHKNKQLIIAAFVTVEAENNSEGAKQLKATGAQQYGSYLKMLEAQNGQLDLCFIPTGIQWHARMTIDALKIGCNVLVEKPLAGSTSDGQAVIDAMNETGRWVAVGFQDMYTDEVATLKRMILKKRIGRIKTVSMLGLWPRARSYYQRNNWTGRLRADDAFVLDSPLNNAFAHFVNLSLFLAGDTFEQTGDAFLNNAQLYRAQDIESFDTAVVQATSQSGTEFWFGVSHACQSTLEPIIRIEGTRGSIEWNQDYQCTIHHTTKEDEILPLLDSFQARDKMFETVLERLSNPDTRVCGPEIAICHTRLIESIHRIGKITTFDPSQIKEVPLEGTNSTVPVVTGLEDRLKEAFENLSDLRAPQADQNAIEAP
ncbi:MAG: Gfo/Idh/MocA family oxidoreductase [Opitutales bacterium]|nr:Gfo/Idh/MocA family oxidoreductase [Opitutales bacterium]